MFYVFLVMYTLIQTEYSKNIRIIFYSSAQPGSTTVITIGSKSHQTSRCILKSDIINKIISSQWEH